MQALARREPKYGTTDVVNVAARGDEVLAGAARPGGEGHERTPIHRHGVAAHPVTLPKGKSVPDCSASAYAGAGEGPTTTVRVSCSAGLTPLVADRCTRKEPTTDGVPLIFSAAGGGGAEGEAGGKAPRSR